VQPQHTLKNHFPAYPIYAPYFIIVLFYDSAAIIRPRMEKPVADILETDHSKGSSMKIYRFEGEHPVACEAADIQGIEAIIILTHTELENFSLPAHWKSLITGGKRCTRIDTFHGMLYISLDIPEEVGVIAAIWESGQLILSGEEHSPLLENNKRSRRSGSGGAHKSILR
jgi:hypothetical protein